MIKKYLKPFSKIAIELVLIIIGVFVGLQVDRWNDKLKDQDREQAILIDIKSDLLASSDQIKGNIEFNSFSVDQLKRIKNYLKGNNTSKNEINFSLRLLSEWQSPYLTSTAYQTFKGNELGLIRNLTLKKEIIRLHEIDFAYIIKDYDKTESDFSKSVVWPFLTKNMGSLDSMNYETSSEIMDYLKDSKEFVMILNLLIDLRSKGLNSLMVTQRDISKIINLIEVEINQ